MGGEVGQGVVGTGSGAGINSFVSPFSSSGVIKSIGSMSVFFKRSKARCARPVTPVANDFIGRYVTSGSFIEPLAENSAVAIPLRSPAKSRPKSGIVFRNWEYDPNGLTAQTMST